jgi:hypothetical protein
MDPVCAPQSGPLLQLRGTQRSHVLAEPYVRPSPVVLRT